MNKNIVVSTFIGMVLGTGLGMLFGVFLNKRNWCVYVHDQYGKNYEWLNADYGIVKKIEFEEPINSGHWKDYNYDWWKIHCEAVSHDVNNLVEDHMNSFVYPDTRFARLKFTFTDGSIYLSDDENTFRHFYELEKRYFLNHQK